jgi:predicted RNA-binding Zn-ribbon protein involved in translation (DUF1610 family)
VTHRTWTFTADDGPHELHVRHSWWSGTAEVWIDGELYARRERNIIDGGFTGSRTIGGRRVDLVVQPLLASFSYDLWIDGQWQPAVCPTCGYALRDATVGDACPECGTVISPPQNRWRQSPEPHRVPPIQAGRPIALPPMGRWGVIVVAMLGLGVGTAMLLVAVTGLGGVALQTLLGTVGGIVMLCGVALLLRPGGVTPAARRWSDPREAAAGGDHAG